MNSRERQLQQTRRAILDALAAEISESGMVGLTMQRVADRAGVTHRTLYNHFPTREALNDAFAQHVEDTVAELGNFDPGKQPDLGSLPKVARQAHELMGAYGPHLQAYVLMTIASGMPARVFRKRSAKVEKRIERDLGPLPPGAAKLVTSAIRLFLSSAGWHLLTRHHGLTDAESGRVSEWAVRLLLAAVRKGDVPVPIPSTKEDDDAG